MCGEGGANLAGEKHFIQALTEKEISAGRMKMGFQNEMKQIFLRVAAGKIEPKE